MCTELFKNYVPTGAYTRSSQSEVPNNATPDDIPSPMSHSVHDITGGSGSSSRSMSDSDDEIGSGLVQQNDDDGSKDEMVGYFLFNVVAPLILNQPKIHWLLELLNGVDTQFYNALRLTKPCFRALVDEFKTRELLFNSQRAHVFVEEKVVIFLRTIGHQHKHRVLGDQFQHSLSTINHDIHDVLRALLTLSPLYITPPDFVNTPQRVLNSHDFYPYFKDVIGVVDGSLIPA
ncbi:hypothetical protein ACS0TY_006509 [Phlomoides rotata]